MNLRINNGKSLLLLLIPLSHPLCMQLYFWDMVSAKVCVQFSMMAGKAVRDDENVLVRNDGCFTFVVGWA